MTIFDDNDKFSRSKWKPKEDKSDNIRFVYPNKTIKEKKVNFYSIPGTTEIIYREERNKKPWWKFW